MTEPRVRMIHPAEAANDPGADLGSRLAAGDERAFDELVRGHSAGVRRLAHRLLGWRQAEADDVAQEVFMQAYLNRAAFRGEGSVRGWLARITVNACRRLQRRKWLSGSVLWRLWQASEAAEPVEPAGDDETAGAVRAAVQRLPAAEREVVVMYYLEQMSAAEVAAILRTTTGAVNVRLHRARKRLETLLAGFGGFTHE